LPEIIGRIVNDLKDEAKPYQKMVMETITKVVPMLSASDIDKRLEVRLVDGIVYSFQEQITEDQAMLDGFGTVVNALGIRVKPYLTQIVCHLLRSFSTRTLLLTKVRGVKLTKLEVHSTLLTSRIHPIPFDPRDSRQVLTNSFVPEFNGRVLLRLV
jgi:splicing factor 3B subunit 1